MAVFYEPETKMATNMKIVGQSDVDKAAYRYYGHLDVWAKGGFRKYQARAAIKKLEKISEVGGEATFRVELVDGIAFTATARTIVFSQLAGEHKLGPQPGDFPVIPGSKPPLSDRGEAIKTLTGFLLICGFIYWMVSGPSSNKQVPTPVTAPPAYTKVSESEAQVMTKVLCEDRMKSGLKSPSSADFETWSQAKFDGKSSATLSSYVDAQNGFGARIRTRFVCKARYTGGDHSQLENWKIVDFVVFQ